MTALGKPEETELLIITSIGVFFEAVKQTHRPAFFGPKKQHLLLLKNINCFFFFSFAAHVTKCGRLSSDIEHAIITTILNVIAEKM